MTKSIPSAAPIVQGTALSGFDSKPEAALQVVISLSTNSEQRLTDKQNARGSSQAQTLARMACMYHSWAKPVSRFDTESSTQPSQSLPSLQAARAPQNPSLDSWILWPIPYYRCMQAAESCWLTRASSSEQKPPYSGASRSSIAALYGCYEQSMNPRVSHLPEWVN